MTERKYSTSPDLQRATAYSVIGHALSEQEEVPILNAFDAAAAIVIDDDLRSALTSIREALVEGGEIHTAMTRSGYAFTSDEVDAFRVGEERGELEKTFLAQTKHIRRNN